MKHKIYGLLLAACMVCLPGSLNVSAQTADMPVTAVTASEETTQTVSAATSVAPVKTVSMTVKVNSTAYYHKALKIKKSKIKNLYNVNINNNKIVSDAGAGMIKGLKKGSAVITLTSKKTGDVYAEIDVNVKNRYNKRQLRLMSSIIYAEAGSECYAGKKAVGIVIMNRVRSEAYPNTLKGVIYDPYQFGPVRNGSLKTALKLYDKGKMNKKCIKAAKATLNGDTIVTYKKVTTDMSSYLFFSGYVSGKRLQIQGHQFK